MNDVAGRGAPVTTILSLTICVVVAAFGVLAPLAHWLIEPTVLPAPFAEQNQDAETLLFVLSFAVLLPAALLVVPRLADRVAAGPNAAVLGPLGAFAAALLLGLLVFLKLSERLPWNGGIGVLLAVSLAWFSIVGGLLLRCLATGATPRAGVAAWERWSWAAALILAAALALSFAQLGSIAIAPLVAGLLVAGGAAALLGRRLPRVPLAAGRAWDAAAVVLLVLAVPNLVIFSPEDPAAATDTTIIQFHQNFFLGPANQVLGGGAMLVDTLSQYGVGSIYFLDAWFQVAPIGNGTLGLLEGILAGAVFALAYLILRGAGAGRLLASVAMAAAVVVLVLNLIYPVGALLQHGAIRFGLPIGLLAAAVLEARRPDRAGLARTIQLAIVAVASIWALEAFAYTLITLAGLIAFDLVTAASSRRRLVVMRVAQVLGACVVAHVLFAAITLAAAGELPDWGLYLETLREFLAGGIGDLTYDFSPWSAGLATAGLLLASSAAIVLVVRRRPGLVEESRAALVALSGSTAYGIALFSYFVNRSADHILPYVSLPVVMIAALWLSLLLRPSRAIAPTTTARRAALGLAAGAAALLVAVAWSSAGQRFSESALAYAAPGGRSLEAGLERLWDPPELAPGAREGERLLERYMPGEDRSVVLTSADLGIEILMETERINTIPLSDPWEDSLVPSQHIDEVRAAVDALEPGDRLLVDGAALEVLADYERDPSTGQISQATIVPSGIALLQEEALREIAERFRLRPIAQGDDGVVVAELVARESAG